MNVITIAGTTGKDAEMKYLNDGTAIASFSVADSQGKDKTVWWNASIFGKRAESLGQYILKGTKVTISGQVTEDVWTDKNGQERRTMKVRVNDIALQSKRESGDTPQEERRAAPKPAQVEFDDDGSDVPF
jgi:single-strand DNA-binding protein